MSNTPASAVASLFELEQELPLWAVQGEQLEFTLQLGGLYAGVQQWNIQPRRAAIHICVHTEYGGVLSARSIWQNSFLHPRNLALLSYHEGENVYARSFELEMDYSKGLVSLKQYGETAQMPLIQPMLDPVSLLLWLREWNASIGQSQSLRLAGGNVHTQRLADSDAFEQQGENGEALPAAVETFVLRPAAAGLWRSGRGGAIVRMSQPSRFGVVEAIPSSGIWKERPKQKPRRKRV